MHLKMVPQNNTKKGAKPHRAHSLIVGAALGGVGPAPYKQQQQQQQQQQKQQHMSAQQSTCACIVFAQGCMRSARACCLVTNVARAITG
jgi:uncharacterized protein HemX